MAHVLKMRGIRIQETGYCTPSSINIPKSCWFMKQCCSASFWHKDRLPARLTLPYPALLIHAYIKNTLFLSRRQSQDSPLCVGGELDIKIMFDWLWWPMCWPPLITVLVDNNRARLQGMEVERERRELKLITASIWLTLAQLLSLLSYSLSLSPSVCVDFLQCLL